VTCSRQVLAIALVAVSTACAPKVPSLPTGTGVPLPDVDKVYLQAGARCRDVQSLLAVLDISGRAAGQRLRASLDAGFQAPDSFRLELPAPGRPVFTFAAIGSGAILILGREGRVLKGAPPADVLDALTGVPFGPDQLREILTGCGFGVGTPTSGRLFSDGRAVIEAGPIVSYVVQGNDKQWGIFAARYREWQVFYETFASGLPTTIRLVSTGADRDRTDLRIRLSQVDINKPIDPSAFLPEIPADATPITLDQLRQAGPRGR
jgi:hypothetical protein